jgi:hypothetical protein
VVYYRGDKAIIREGPWTFAHSFFMETKIHRFLMLVLLATFLPIAAYGDVVRKRATRHIILWTSALVVLLALAMEGKGTFISMGVKIAVLAKKYLGSLKMSAQETNTSTTKSTGAYVSGFATSYAISSILSALLVFPRKATKQFIVV